MTFDPFIVWVQSLIKTRMGLSYRLPRQEIVQCGETVPTSNNNNRVNITIWHASVMSHDLSKARYLHLHHQFCHYNWHITSQTHEAAVLEDDSKELTIAEILLTTPYTIVQCNYLQKELTHSRYTRQSEFLCPLLTSPIHKNQYTMILVGLFHWNALFSFFSS